jgi:hypothetical protein
VIVLGYFFKDPCLLDIDAKMSMNEKICLVLASN